MRLLLFLFLFCVAQAGPLQAQPVYEVQNSTLTFHSSAPKELITAATTELRGLLDLGKRVFVFKVSVSSFKGFNNSLQQEHFRENYMESYLYPDALYNGKIIEDVSLDKPGVYQVRAKGKLLIHGVAQERIIRSRITVKEDRILVSSEFTVLLRDHNIKVPRVVYEKLAAEINVTLEAVLLPKKPL
jgi:hypothetical protein